MNIPPNLIDEFGKGQGVLFIGAGMSKGAGLPDWKELMRPLADELKRSSDEDPTKIAQYYQNEPGGRHLLIKHIRRELTKSNPAPTTNHARLARLPVQVVFTTNFDNLMKRALDQANRPVHLLVNDKSISYWNEHEQVQLVHLHGSLDDEDSLVIAADDYATYFRDHPNMSVHLDSMLMTRPFLFVGYSLSDADFWQIYNRSRFDLGEHKQPAYAVFLNGDLREIKNLERTGMRVINLTVPPGGDYNATLGEFLEAFLKQLPPPSKSGVETKIVPVPTPRTPVERLADRVEKLLVATRHTILKRAAQPPRQIYLLVGKNPGLLGETKLIVACCEGEIEIADVRALERALTDAGAASGYLVSEARVVPAATRQACQATNGRVDARTLDAFYRILANFEPYVRSLITAWERDKDEIAKYYIDLGGKRPHFDDAGNPVGEPEHHKPLDPYFDEWLNTPGDKHISILGDYGTGKTTLVRHYAYLLAQRYLANSDHARIPILIPLRQYNKAMSLSQLVTEYLVNDQKECIRLDGGYAAFEQLNRDGKFVLIFDGFDEMSRQVTNQTTLDNFNQLYQAAVDDAKVLLTCRTHYFRTTAEAHRLLAGEELSAPHAVLERSGEGKQVKDQSAINPAQYRGFRMIRLDEFTPADVMLLLQKRFPTEWEKHAQRTRDTHNLTELSQTPVLLDMIVQALPEWGTATITNRAGLYRHCTEKWLAHEFKTGETFTNQDKKRFFSEQVATEMFRTEQTKGIHHSKFPAIIKQRFEIELADETDKFAHEILTHSFLSRDDDGLYRFKHNSIMEFFVAQRLWRALHAGEILPLSATGEGKGRGEMPLNEEIRAFICEYFDGKLPAFAAPTQVPAGMVYIPLGPFVMGGEVYDNEKPTRIATLVNGFFIDQYPVTQAQYKKFVDAARHSVPKADAEWAKPYNWDPKTRAFPPGLENHPVVLVSWDDASAYAKWAGKRLPTELEWEKAARGIDGRVYPWSDQWDRNKCNNASWWMDEDIITYDDWEKKFKPRWEKEWQGKKVMTTPVGQFKDGTSPYGCFDMAGNVWEWTADWYSDEKKTRAVRGGSWDNRSSPVRGAVRSGGPPDNRSSGLGFRCAE